MKENYSTSRQQNRVVQSKIKKAFKSRRIVPSNEAFNRIKFELIDFGWVYEENHNNVVEYYGKWVVTTTPALKLFSDVFHVTLIPYEEGIEISRLEVYEEFQCKGFAGNILRCLLHYLLQHEIYDVFLIPLPAGLPENLSSSTLDIPQLQKFYSKRGFRKLPKNAYWKLDKNIFTNYCPEEGVDFELLRSCYNPMSSSAFIGKSLYGKFKSMPIKMMIYNRA